MTFKFLCISEVTAFHEPWAEEGHTNLKFFFCKEMHLALERKKTKQSLSTDRILKAGIKISTTMVIVKFAI